MLEMRLFLKSYFFFSALAFCLILNLFNISFAETKNFKQSGKQKKSEPLKVYKKQRKAISDLPIKNNWQVRRWMSYFQNKGRPFFKKALMRSHRYLPQWKKIFAEKQMPRDLAYVALLESGFLAHAKSSAQAVGYWQFLKSTAKRYGLKQSWWLDERKDYLKSTRAASSYLKDLYEIFHSWELALAAYNMGEHRLISLIKKHKTKNFWKLSNKSDFPQETRNYVPKIMASIVLAKLPTLYGFKNPKLPPLSYKTVWVPGGTKLAQVSHELGTNLSQLKKLNPSLRRSIIPKWEKKGFWIRVPKSHKP